MNKRPTPEYRAYVVKLVVEEGRKATQLAFELGIGESTIRRWVKAKSSRNTRDPICHTNRVQANAKRL
ncbi:transposase [Lysinibacillus sphaericus]|uniref:transposase n=1 Tax=Lysinibacillus sphaericus TaxID=1421 RepID=UPI003F799CEB